MKKACVVIGIILIIAGILALLFGGLFWYASTHTLDGSAALYHRQRSNMIIAFVIGILIVIVGIVALIKGR